MSSQMNMSENPILAHAVCIPFPAQGHINPMMKLAKLLHGRGFYITFVNSEFNHRRLLKSRGPHSLDGLKTFRFETIPDGLPESDENATQDITSLCKSTTNTCLAPFKHLISKIRDSGAPPVTCIISDGVMSFTLDAAEELGIPQVLFWTTSAVGFMGYLHYTNFMENGYTPFKDESYFGNGYLDTAIDWIPGMEGMRLKDFPSFFRTKDPNDFMLHFAISVTNKAKRSSAIVFNTFNELEADVIRSLCNILPPPIYTIGPLHLLMNELEHDEGLNALGSNLWKEETECLDWLDSKQPGSVVYVNFGSITVMTAHHLIEFAWGLANTQKPFLWIIRPDILAGDTAILPAEFLEETKERSMMVSWCPQEKVLAHQAIGVFLTHGGWNSTIESISVGVPMICWPFFAEQPTNCWFCCEKWGIAKEIDSDVKRADVEGLVRGLMDGEEEGKKMKDKAIEWKKKAEEAVGTGGSSQENLDKLINQVLLLPSRNS
ncbi:7-deoxyloganetin glucosyltransferase-like [Impatiens glandulifera]|uniref:7-deoxyloganetin glucosyltransferase-like n=1 Tax=Impatiens glandulifera TaxID=253017 RepID=UPI001FB074E1|nr:7-deoxyloganetin glucosyltransferase-like [Impatiens glandulifera]